MPAFVHNQIGAVDKQESAVRVEGVRQEEDVEDGPRHNRRAGDRLPRFVENRLQIFEHAAADDPKSKEAGLADYQRVCEKLAWTRRPGEQWASHVSNIAPHPLSC